MEDATGDRESSKGASTSGAARRILHISAGASHTVAVLYFLQLLQLLEMNPYPDSYSVYKQLWEAGVVTREIAAVSLCLPFVCNLTGSLSPSCAGDVVCSWGRGEDGQLGHGDAEERHLPTIVSALEDCEITFITCGADHTTACSNTQKTVHSWGWGDFGRLGHGNSSDLFLPHPIQLLQGLEIKQIACGDSHCLAISTDGEAYSWGRNQNGQLGLGNTEDSFVPQKLQAFQGLVVKMLAAGAEHSAGITESGKLYGWGWGRYGNLGLGDRKDRSVPVEVAAISGEKMKMVACGWRHTIVVSENGKIFTFGWSKYGQLGHGDFQDQLVPFQVQALREKKIQAITGGWRHSIALDEEGRLYGWGWNKFGQVGCGNTVDQNSPQIVKGLNDERVTKVSCGWRHTVAITERGNVYSWGRGTSGQLGHGDTVDRSIPKRIELLSLEGQACQQLESSRSTNSAASNWVPPVERYAVVPEETLGVLARRLNQTASAQCPMALCRMIEKLHCQLHARDQVELLGQGEPSRSEEHDASVPDTDTKRLRTGH